MAAASREHKCTGLDVHQSKTLSHIIKYYFTHADTLSGKKGNRFLYFDDRICSDLKFIFKVTFDFCRSCREG